MGRSSSSGSWCRQMGHVECISSHGMMQPSSKQCLHGSCTTSWPSLNSSRHTLHVSPGWHDANRCGEVSSPWLTPYSAVRISATASDVVSSLAADFSCSSGCSADFSVSAVAFFAAVCAGFATGEVVAAELMVADLGPAGDAAAHTSRRGSAARAAAEVGCCRGWCISARWARSCSNDWPMPKSAALYSLPWPGIMPPPARPPSSAARRLGPLTGRVPGSTIIMTSPSWAPMGPAPLGSRLASSGGNSAPAGKTCVVKSISTSEPLGNLIRWRCDVVAFGIAEAAALPHMCRLDCMPGGRAAC
mmetsp:Transcript_1055/g.3223  ORF Transcript_1055/g.3223 Transcript_1055/m.3223 type:complete len:303 (+) Transcript_1055:1959-2867(+)